MSRRPQQQHGATHTQVGATHSGICWVEDSGLRHEQSRGRAARPTAAPHRTSSSFSTPHGLGSGGRATHGTNISHSNIHTPIKQALDTTTRLKAKQHYKLIQALHHREHIERGIEQDNFPPGMLRQTFKLASFIKPSSPTLETTDKIKENTINWMSHNMHILFEHYTNIITQLTNTPGNPLALLVATQWARRRYSHKLDPHTITTAHNLLFPTASASCLPSPNPNSQPDEDPQLSPHLTHSYSSFSQSNFSFLQPVDNTSATALHSPPTSPPRCCPQRTLSTVAPVESCQPGESTTLPPKNNKNNIQVSQSRSDKRTSTCVNTDSGPKGVIDGNIHLPAPAPWVQHNRESALTDSEAAPRSSGEPVGVNEMMSKQGHKINMIDRDSNSDPPSATLKTHRPGARAEQSGSPASVADVASASDPTYHQTRDSRKLRAWEFKVTKPIGILGDCNINRIPKFNHPFVQADCYPGATLYHFWKILEKTTINHQTQVLILSVGINNRTQDPLNTSIKQLRKVVNRANLVFPNADIVIPLINHSPHLPQAQQDNLGKLNKFISEHLTHFPAFPDDHFETLPDLTTWTTETAKKIFNHWLTELKYFIMELEETYYNTD